MSRRLSGADNRKAMLHRSLPQGDRGYELLRAALTEVDDSRPPAFRRLEQAVGGELARMLVGALRPRQPRAIPV
ncbi:MAG: hypothetical protein M3O92_00275 [Actinomycetota bacterium]|nr:hypothetical protein [Actinomycetota bacterium]